MVKDIAPSLDPTGFFVKNEKIKPPIQSGYTGSFLNKVIANDAGKDVLNFIAEQIDLSKDNLTFLSLRRNFFYANNNSAKTRSVVNLNPINGHKNLNTYFSYINTLLPDAGIYIGCYEDYAARKQRILKKDLKSIRT